MRLIVFVHFKNDIDHRMTFHLPNYTPFDDLSGFFATQFRHRAVLALSNRPEWLEVTLNDYGHPWSSIAGR